MTSNSGGPTPLRSIFKLIRSATALARMLSTLDSICEENAPGGSGSWFTLAELLNLQESGQFPDDPVKIEDTQIHREDDQTY